MKSLRLWFLFALLNTSFVVMIAFEVRRVAIQTSDWRDIIVMGRGYIHTLDENGNHPMWLRSAHLGINQDSLLCAKVNDELRLLEPRISIPSEWMEINIDLYGRITVSDPGSAGLSIGTIPVTTFLGDESGDPIRVTNPENRLGPPHMQLAGESGAGLLMQRTALQYCLPLTVRTLLTVFMFVLLALSGFWYTWKTQWR